ncbi:MAG: TniQ family protein [Mycobacterium sp.]
MSADVRHLPVTTAPADGEALDSYLERVAADNGYTNPALLRVLTRGDPTAALLTIAPDPDVLQRLAALVDQPPEPLRQLTLAGVPGIPTSGYRSPGRKAWRQMASAGWAPGRGTALCPACLASDGIWRITWRHPWVTACLDHRRWLVGTCPTCSQRFRSQRTPLRTVDADPHCCGNPGGSRAHGCRQPLGHLVAQPAPRDVLVSQRRIDNAIHGSAVACAGEVLDPSSYLAELKALTVLLLHLAVQPAGDQLAEWADLARADHQRSTGTRGARWALAPPADLILRGQALADADAILRQPTLDAAADALHPWTELAPATNDGQLGWLADHTTMTPLLSRLVMAATATRRRLATLLDAAAPGTAPLHLTAIPQVLPADLYARWIVGMLDVADRSGRLFAALCLARRRRPGSTWAEAAAALDLPPDVGVRTARACSADLLVTAARFIAALAHAAANLDPTVDYRTRENAVRRLARRRDWYRPWARTHLPGSHATSKPYAVTWLWTSYAHGHIDTSPGWQQAPDHHRRAHYRAYARRLGPAATEALTALVATTTAT